MEQVKYREAKSWDQSVGPNSPHPLGGHSSVKKEDLCVESHRAGWLLQEEY